MKKYLLLSLGISLLLGQEIKWQRKSQPVKYDLLVFHSTMVANLPTAQTVGPGDFEFEISHRFRAPVSVGFNDFFGMDAGANMRIALAYGIAKNTMIAIGRSNVDKNFDLKGKYRFYQWRNMHLPAVFAVQGGVAWNTQERAGRNRTDGKNFQYYLQVIANTIYKNRMAIGIIPSYLYNSYIDCRDTQNSFTFGNYYQFYFYKVWSIWFEFNPTVTGWRRYHNSYAFGFELETGGHFFKVFLVNNSKLNLTQYLSGADDYGNGEYLLAFTITRIL